ncbi:phosphotransferase [Actinopolymorpha sp. B9G3]|uniref:phosphotransferase enzyme family protein n=1 Tax=Actinopolymorpha sp. B9G3 TaxID=3158970 RepID=UPI0032D92E82
MEPRDRPPATTGPDPADLGTAAIARRLLTDGRLLTGARLLDAWRLPSPTDVRRADGGTNNVVLIVDVGASSYVLRIYQNLSQKRIAAEHRLLDALSGAGLPFAVPQPIPTPEGRTYVETPDGFAALFRYLPGRTADGDNLAELEYAGEALALLGLALAELPAALAPIDWRMHPLDRMHPAVTDLDDLADELARAVPETDGVEWLRRHAGPTAGRYAELCRTLPVRIVHGDFAMSNLVVDDDGRPAAILDFEIAGLDVAVNEVVTGVAQAAGGWWSADEGQRASAFYRGFVRHIPLTSGERAAFPDLVRLRVLGTIVWRAGRWRLGQSHLDEVRLRLATGVHIGRWLDAHAATLPDDLAAL